MATAADLARVLPAVRLVAPDAPLRLAVMADDDQTTTAAGLARAAMETALNERRALVVSRPREARTIALRSYAALLEVLLTHHTGGDWHVDSASGGRLGHATVLAATPGVGAAAAAAAPTYWHTSLVGEYAIVVYIWLRVELEQGHLDEADTLVEHMLAVVDAAVGGDEALRVQRFEHANVVPERAFWTRMRSLFHVLNALAAAPAATPFERLVLGNRAQRLAEEPALARVPGLCAWLTDVARDMHARALSALAEQLVTTWPPPPHGVVVDTGADVIRRTCRVAWAAFSLEQQPPLTGAPGAIGARQFAYERLVIEAHDKYGINVLSDTLPRSAAAVITDELGSSPMPDVVPSSLPKGTAFQMRSKADAELAKRYRDLPAPRVPPLLSHSAEAATPAAPAATPTLFGRLRALLPGGKAPSPSTTTGDELTSPLLRMADDDAAADEDELHVRVTPARHQQLTFVEWWDAAQTGRLRAKEIADAAAGYYVPMPWQWLDGANPWIPRDFWASREAASAWLRLYTPSEWASIGVTRAVLKKMGIHRGRDVVNGGDVWRQTFDIIPMS